MSVGSTATSEGNISVISGSSEENTKHNSRKYDPITKKVDLRLIPFFALLEISSYMNRIVIGMYVKKNYFLLMISFHSGQAKLMGLQHDLNMSSDEYNWAISIFFLLYVRK